MYLDCVFIYTSILISSPNLLFASDKGLSRGKMNHMRFSSKTSWVCNLSCVTAVELPSPYLADWLRAKFSNSSRLNVLKLLSHWATSRYIQEASIVSRLHSTVTVNRMNLVNREVFNYIESCTNHKPLMTSRRLEEF